MNTFSPEPSEIRYEPVTPIPCRPSCRQRNCDQLALHDLLTPQRRRTCKVLDYLEGQPAPIGPEIIRQYDVISDLVPRRLCPELSVNPTFQPFLARHRAHVAATTD